MVSDNKRPFNQIKYQNEYNKQHYDTILVALPKGTKQKVKEKATSCNKSMNRYIYDVICNDLESEL